METDYKQYYCEKYKAICLLKNKECTEGIQIVSHKSWWDTIECYGYGDYKEFIQGEMHLEMTTKTGEILYGFDHPVDLAGHGCEEIQHMIEQKRLKLEEEARQKAEEQVRLDKIRLTPLFEIPTSECSCDTCKGYCSHRPCWGTPQDIQVLIDAGYADRLMLDWWVGDDSDSNIYLIVPALYGSEGTTAPYDPRGNCNFFKNGLCEIHSIKPIEGKIAHHNDYSSEYNVHEKIALSWNTEEGYKLVEKWRKLVKCWADPEEPESWAEMFLL